MEGGRGANAAHMWFSFSVFATRCFVNTDDMRVRGFSRCGRPEGRVFAGGFGFAVFVDAVITAANSSCVSSITGRRGADASPVVTVVASRKFEMTLSRSPRRCRFSAKETDYAWPVLGCALAVHDDFSRATPVQLVHHKGARTQAFATPAVTTAARGQCDECRGMFCLRKTEMAKKLGQKARSTCFRSARVVSVNLCRTHRLIVSLCCGETKTLKPRITTQGKPDAYLPPYFRFPPASLRSCRARPSAPRAP